ncbi:hypothetical protein L1987_68080 [Smallanthus sonchifolius]|uniref:Uncharacterized protein n=1 Tax=Smallanthus sonchifolius TaxID=185202 RepID=A0ACB9B321_9ASTR|nr:hypothetical protein L1987_68080 [Smallanthus sonchifolius]
MGSTWVLMLLLLGANGGARAISCQDAIARMLPCQGFLMGFSEMSAACCHSAQSLSQTANSSPVELTSVCQCLKQAIGVIGINMNRAQQIPQLCHIDLDTGLIDPNVDCNKY